MHAHLARDVTEDLMAIVELNPEHAIWQGLCDNTLAFDRLFLFHRFTPILSRLTLSCRTFEGSRIQDAS